MGTDQLPDRLLARSSTPHDGMKPTGPCLDAETLAAWTDGTLNASARSAAELHAADCDRCLAMLAAMAKTDPPPIAAEPRPWFSWRWLVPLATASIALTTWIVLRDVPAQEPRPSPSVVQTAPPAPPPAQPEASVSEKAATDRVAPLRRDEARQRKETAASKTEVAKSVPEPPARTPPPPAGAPAADSLAAAAQFRSFAPTVILSPDPNVSWRVAGSTLERSVDAGVTWHRQASGVSGVFTAGSSPARDVCWIVGRAGTVLLTTDGENWRRLDFPDPKADLRTVTATDATHATVTTADGRTYVTTDGGARWLLQENAPAPF